MKETKMAENKETNLKTWLQNYDKEAVAAAKSKSTHEKVSMAINYGFYDWFCKNESLLSRIARMEPKLRRIAKSPKIDTEKNYVFFKNNCPISGGTYDDFRICDIESGDVIFNVVPYEPRKEQAEVWGKENDFEQPLATGTIKDIYTFFGV
jgi:hypothetical protein